MVDVFCPYCGAKAKLLNGMSVYNGRIDLMEKYFYVCNPCDARVGCHPKTKKPLGSLAKKNLRDLRVKAHAAFDAIWKGTKIKRGHAYHLLATLFQKSSVHISHMDEAEAALVPRYASIILDVLSFHEGEYGEDVKEEVEAIAAAL